MGEMANKYLGSIKKMLPDRDSNTSVGVDIGVDSIKMVELTKSAHGFKLLNWGIEPVAGGDFKEAIRKSVNGLENLPKFPYTGISGKGTLIRYINMPRMSASELKKSFGFEADKYFPFPREQMFTDCYILDSTKSSGNTMLILAAASKKELVQQRIEVLSDLGFQTTFIGLNPIALANAYTVLSSPSEEHQSVKNSEDDTDKPIAVAIMDIGGALSHLMILIGNFPRFNRDIYIGGHEFAKRISNALSISVDEAVKLKHSPGDKHQEIISACESSILNLITEMRLSFDYFTTEHNTTISKLVLTGGASQLQGLPEQFSKNLDIPVEQWGPASMIELDEAINKEEIEKSSHQLSVAIGLALYHYS